MCDALFFSVELGISYKSGLCVMHCFFCKPGYFL